MPDKQNKSSYNTILSQTGIMEGDTQIVLTEYVNGAKFHRKIRPKRPFYKHVWFYLLIILSLFVPLAVEHYLQ